MNTLISLPTFQSLSKALSCLVKILSAQTISFAVSEENGSKSMLPNTALTESKYSGGVYHESESLPFVELVPGFAPMYASFFVLAFEIKFNSFIR